VRTAFATNGSPAITDNEQPITINHFDFSANINFLSLMGFLCAFRGRQYSNFYLLMSILQIRGSMYAYVMRDIDGGSANMVKVTSHPPASDSTRL